MAPAGRARRIAGVGIYELGAAFLRVNELVSTTAFVGFTILASSKVAPTSHATIFGARSSMVAKVDRAVAELRQREGRLTDARRAFERALWGLGAANKDDSLQTATTLLKFADCLRDLEDPRAEHDALVRALNIREAVLPPGNPDIAEVRERLRSSLGG